MRILLYRPSLARFIAIHNATPLDQNKQQATLYEALLLHSSSLCVEVAISAIEAIHTHLPKSVAAIGLLPAWWYNVLYVYTAAVVLLAAARCPSMQSKISQELILERSETAIFILRRYKIYSSTVQRSVAALEALFAQIPGQEQTNQLAESDHIANRYQSWSNHMAYNDSVHGQSMSQSDQCERSQGPSFQRYSGRPQTGEEPVFPIYETNTSPSCTMNQPTVTQPGIDFNSMDLNMSLDMHDFSWLDSLPFNV